jgi:arginyl-tRNA--protein-N-Asp/Glu arginylyltransferase
MEPAAKELTRFQTRPRACSYLPAETATLEYRVFALMGSRQYRDMLRRGWRRHGPHFFRPRCAACTQCRSLRVLVPEFRASRSQRKILGRNADVRVTVQTPSVSPDHVRVYNAYHADMAERKGWTYHPTDPEDYENSFLVGIWPFAREILYHRDGELIGVGLVDVVEDALSSVYFFHDPTWRAAGPGTFSILQEIEYCRQTGRTYNYLGYWIAACGSMAYKANFAPHEILEHYVEQDEEPVWTRPDSARGLDERG